MIDMMHTTVLYGKVGWPSLEERRKRHWLLCIFKALKGKLPLYIANVSLELRQLYDLFSYSKVLQSIQVLVRRFFGMMPLTLGMHCSTFGALPSLKEFRTLVMDSCVSNCNCFR